jgi:predicted secreted hydrolase
MAKTVGSNKMHIILPLDKIFVIAILLAGLLNLSVYFSGAANASTPTSTGSTAHVIVGDTAQYMKHEGLTSEMQPWENGMRTNPMPGTFEWWYFQGAFDDGSHTEITYLVKPWMDNSGPLDPYIGFSLTTANGTVHRDQIHISTDKFLAARNTLNVTMGNNWVRGDLKTIKLHAESPRGFGADLVFNSVAPPGRFGGAGLWYFDSSLTKISGVMDPMPYAQVQGNLTYDGQSHHVQGIGYHDRQWGNINWNRDIDSWYWSTGHYGNYTIDIGLQVTSADYNHQVLSTMYLARGNQVIYDTMRGVTSSASGENITDPSGAHTYPNILNLHWQNGTDTVNLALTSPKIVQAGSSVIRTNATIVGTPEYLRLSGNGTLNVNIGGKNETSSTPAVWEVQYGH